MDVALGSQIYQNGPIDSTQAKGALSYVWMPLMKENMHMKSHKLISLYIGKYKWNLNKGFLTWKMFYRDSNMV